MSLVLAIALLVIFAVLLGIQLTGGGDEPEAGAISAVGALLALLLAVSVVL